MNKDYIGLLDRQPNEKKRNWKREILWTIIGIGIVILAISALGCQTAPMTAKSKLDVKGPVVVVEKTTTTTINPDGTQSSKVVETSTTKSESAADLEIKNNELKGRTKVGTFREFLRFLFQPSPFVYGGANYSGGTPINHY